MKYDINKIYNGLVYCCYWKQPEYTELYAFYVYNITSHRSIYLYMTYLYAKTCVIQNI
jgi:hypothetical protein